MRKQNTERRKKESCQSFEWKLAKVTSKDEVSIQVAFLIKTLPTSLSGKKFSPFLKLEFNLFVRSAAHWTNAVKQQFTQNIATKLPPIVMIIDDPIKMIFGCVYE